MKWMLLFYICSAVCDKEVFSGKPTASIVREQKIVFYESEELAKSKMRTLEMLGRNDDVFIPIDGKVCSAIEIYRVERSTR